MLIIWRFGFNKFFIEKNIWYFEFRNIFSLINSVWFDLYLFYVDILFLILFVKVFNENRIVVMNYIKFFLIYKIIIIYVIIKNNY